MELSTDVLRGFAGVLRQLQVDTRPLRRQAGIDACAMLGPSVSMDWTVAEQMLGRLFEISEPGVGLDVGMHASMRTLGIVGEVLTHSPTLRAAIDELNAFLPLVLTAQSHFTLNELGDRATLAYNAPFLEPRAARFAVEVVIAFMIRVGREILQQGAPLEVNVRHVAPDAYAARYREVLGCPVNFGRARNEVVFERAALDRQQPFFDLELWTRLRKRAGELLGQQRARESLHERVRDVLRHEPHLRTVSSQEIARRLAISQRSLRLRLEGEGFTLAKIADEVRREIALRDVRNPDVPLKELALRLGFSDASAFYRAFKRWTGSTPGRLREGGGTYQAASVAAH